MQPAGLSLRTTAALPKSTRTSALSCALIGLIEQCGYESWLARRQNALKYDDGRRSFSSFLGLEMMPGQELGGCRSKNSNPKHGPVGLINEKIRLGIKKKRTDSLMSWMQNRCPTELDFTLKFQVTRAVLSGLKHMTNPLLIHSFKRSNQLNTFISIVIT